MVLSRKLICIVIFLLLKNAAVCASTELDSLYNVWDSVGLDIDQRLNALDKILRKKYDYKNADSSYLITKIFKDTLVAHQRYEYDAQAEYHLAVASLYRNPYHTTEVLVRDLIECTNDSPDYRLRTDILNLMAIIHYFQGEHLKSIEMYQNIIDIYDQNDKDKLKGIIYYNMALSYMKVAKLIDAYDALILCREIAERFDDDHIRNYQLGGIVKMYYLINDFEKARGYLYEREEVVLRTDHKKAAIEVYLGLAEIGSKTNEPYDYVNKYIQKAKTLSQEVDWKLMELRAEYRYSILLITMDSLDKAENILNKALETAFELGSDIDKQQINKELSKIYFSKGQYEKVVQTLDRKFQENEGHEMVMKGFRLLADSHFQLGHIDSAYYYQQKSSAYQDSLVNKNNLKDLLRMELSEKYALEKKELLNLQLAQENELLKHKVEKRNFIFLFLFLSLLTAFAIIIALFQRRKQELVAKESAKVNFLNKKLESTNHLLKDSNSKLESFARVVSHDIKSPIRMMSSYLKLIKENLGKGEKEKTLKYMGYVFQTMGTLETMISNILMLSKLSNSKELKLQAVDVKEVIQKVIHNLTLDIKNAEAEVSVNTYDLEPISFNEVHLIQVIQNVLSNAIKYRRKNIDTLIEIRSYIKDEHLQLIIKDNGRGIPQDELGKIYSQFQRLSSSRGVEGNGLGMAITKKIIEMYHGNVRIESEVDQGTTMFFSFPVRQPTVTAEVSV